MTESAPSWPAAPQQFDTPPPPPGLPGAVDPAAMPPAMPAAMTPPAGFAAPEAAAPAPFAPPAPMGAPMEAPMGAPVATMAPPAPAPTFAPPAPAPEFGAPAQAMPFDAPAPMSAPMEFGQAAGFDPAAALDVAAPMPAGVPFAHPDSPALPAAAHAHPVAGAMPTFEQAMATEPAAMFDPTGAVATHPTDAEAAAAAAIFAEGDAASAPAAAGSSMTWWSPGTALVVAMLALAWQLVSFYAREQFPKREAAGLTLDRFDTLFGSMPLVGSPAGAFVGMAFAVAAGFLLYAGAQRGVRERTLQGAVGAIALLALAAPVLLMKLAG